MATYPYPADYSHPGLVQVQAVEAQPLPGSAGVGVLLDAKAGATGGAAPSPADKVAASASAWIRRGRDDDVQYFSLRPVWFAMQAAGFYPAHRLCRGSGVVNAVPAERRCLRAVTTALLAAACPLRAAWQGALAVAAPHPGAVRRRAGWSGAGPGCCRASRGRGPAA